MEEKNVDHRQPEFEVKPRVLWPDCNFGQAHRGQLTDRLSGRIRPKLGDSFRSIPIHREISGENQAKIRPPVSPKGPTGGSPPKRRLSERHPVSPQLAGNSLAEISFSPAESGLPRSSRANGACLAVRYVRRVRLLLGGR